MRQLEGHVRERGGKVKAHEMPLHGTLRMVDRDGGFGFVETPKGEVYFRCNSVVEGEFADLEPGSRVRSRSPRAWWAGMAIGPLPSTS